MESFIVTVNILLNTLKGSAKKKFGFGVLESRWINFSYHISRSAPGVILSTDGGTFIDR